MARAESGSHNLSGHVAVALGAAGALLAASELQVRRAECAADEKWKAVPVRARGSTSLGISFRPRQAETFGLDPASTLEMLLACPFDVIRLGAYWSHSEKTSGQLDLQELDWQVAAAEAAGKKIIVCLGPIKTFGYPEQFVPDWCLREPLPEGSLIEPSSHPALLASGIRFASRVVERYRDHESIIAWQVEHEAVDPLGLEHSWRLSIPFVRKEVNAIRTLDPSRPIMMNGFLPTSSFVALPQWWRTLLQGDSVSGAQRLADIVGLDFYPRHALVSFGGWTLYANGSRRPWQQHRRKSAFRWAALMPDRQVMVAEGQSEPWEHVTTPPNPTDKDMYSCRPQDVIGNYNQAMAWAQTDTALSAYLFWGAEYWVLRSQGGDSRYLDAFKRILEEA